MNKQGNVPLLSFFIKRKFLSAFLLLILAIILFKGSIYRTCITYQVIGTRPVDFVYPSVSPKSDEQLTKEEVIDQALDRTAKMLSFTTGKCLTRGSKLLDGDKTNCIGYADLCRCLLETRFRTREGLDNLHASACKAQIFLFGYNVHQLFDSPFWKDHDIVLITDTKTGERILLDPTLYDYTGIGKVSERK